MKSYWVKIVLGALAVFAVGMIIISIAGRVEDVATSDATIDLPLAFLPFRVNGEQLGDLERVRILRAAPDSITHVRLRVGLADSADAARLRHCILILSGLDNLSNRTTFTCATPADTVGRDLVGFGSVQLGQGGEELPFLIPRSEAPGAHASDQSWERAAEYGDSIAEAIEEQADSIADAAEAVADSVASVELERADSIRSEGMRLADSVRAGAGR